MFKYLMICNCLFISVFRGDATVTKYSEHIALKDELSQLKDHKVTQNVVSEGGSNDTVTLLDEQATVLFNSENELSQNKVKSVVGRKGVNYTHVDVQSNNTINRNSSIPLVNVTVNPHTPTILNKNINKTKILNDTQMPNATKIHKPLILSYEALEKIDKINNVSIEENVSVNKVHSIPGSHPGMIMPIVITILVVPMFAVIGYMALKRGQEAWKNRHYKRMDFLLDGMYND